MASDHERESLSGLTAGERAHLDAIRRAGSLATLRSVVDADSDHEAYFRAKDEWFELRGLELGTPHPVDTLPGDSVRVEDREFTVNGITHANTDAERSFIRSNVAEALANGEQVFCEQGIRRMYFDDIDEVYEMDDYSWAVERSREAGHDSRLDAVGEFDSLREDVDSIASEFRDGVFSLIHSGSTVYGERFTSALGDLASDFLMSHEDLGTAENFESFRRSRLAAEDPRQLPALQHYYKRAFLPQPLEREWLRRHDPELEIFTHARNERLADYAVYDSNGPARLVVGAAHQPGVCYYLDQHRDGERDLENFEFVD